MRLSGHGGGCCGIRHIFGMGSAPNGHHDNFTFQDHQLDPVDRTGRTVLQTMLERYRREFIDGGRLLEIVLTDNQDTHWRGELQRQGFRKVVRFRNYNTRNWCNIWYHYNHPEEFQVFEATMPAFVPQVPQPVPAPHQPQAPLQVGDRVTHVGNVARDIRAHPEYGTGTVVSIHVQTTRVNWGPGFGVLNHWTNCLQRTVEPATVPVPAPVAAGEIVVGSRVRHIGNAALEVHPRPELGEGIVQRIRSHQDVRVIWERDTTRGELGHYLESLELVAAPAVQPQPHPQEPRGAIFNYGAVMWNVERINPTNGDVTARSPAGQTQLFSIVPVDELTELRNRPREQRRVLHSRWRCVYRDDRRGAEYETRNAAVEANPRARRVERIDYFNDGTTEAEIGDI